MRYAAFISYSSIDRAMGERVQRALESYVIPKPLRGQDFGRGPLPKRVGPFFRDRWDADASIDLGVTLHTALQASEALIVLCSPAAARSDWVNEEIRVFSRSGKRDRIYAVLVDGVPDPYDPERTPQGAFPPALFEQESGEPLAPDVRAAGDGLHFTVLKLVAALTGVPLTTLSQRQAEAERRERNIARWIAGAMTVLAMGVAIGAWTSWRASVAARMRLENAVEMAARRVDDAAGFQDRYGVPSKVIHELLDGAKRDFDELTQDAAATPTLSLQRARLDRMFAQFYESAGDGAQHEAMAQRAFEHLASVPTARRIDAPNTWFARLPTARAVQVESILSQEALGQAKAARGDLATARSAFNAMASQADALATASTEADACILAANARSHLSRLAYESGDLDAALQALRAAEAILTQHVASREIAVEVAKVQSDEAEMLLELGRHDEALARQQSAAHTLQQLHDPTPAIQRLLAATLARQGDMRLAASRDLAGARSDYAQAQSLLAEQLSADSARTDIKRDLSLARERLGDALLQAGDVAGAAAEFAACLSLRRELVAHDRANAEWRRDLSVALERTGDVAALQGHHDMAKAAFGEALTLRQAALDAAPGDLVATRDLAVLWMRQGKALADARAPLAAIDAAYAKAIGLLSPLVEQAPPASRLRRDLAVAYAERAAARRKAGQLSGARADIQAALEIVTHLRTMEPDDKQLAQDEAWLRRHSR